MRLWQRKPGPEVIKKCTLNSAEHEMLVRIKNIKKFSFFQAQISRECSENVRS